MAGTLTNKRINNVEYVPNEINGYEIIESLPNSGSEANIYIGKKNDKKFLVKIYNSPLSESMAQTLNTIMGINDAGIAKIVDYGETEGYAYEVQELYENGNVKESLRYFYSHILPRLNHAINTLNSNGIIHMDIKPQNIIMNGKNVKIIDFGVSTSVNENVNGYSVEYSAPEVDSGEYITPKADYYSLGITLFELFMCYNPFKNIDSSKLIELKSDPDSWMPKNVLKGEIFELIQSLVDANPERRWGYAELADWTDKYNNSDILTLINDLPVMAEINNEIKIFFNNNSYDAGNLGAYINDCIYSGEKGCAELFSSERFNDYKQMDSHFSLLVKNYMDMAKQDAIKAAINIKVDYNKDNIVVIPGFAWESIMEAGRGILNCAGFIYNNIILKAALKFVQMLDSKDKVDFFEPDKYDELRLVKDGYFAIYTKDHTLSGKFIYSTNEVAKNFLNYRDTSGETMDLFNIPFNQIHCNFPYTVNNYELLYHFAKIGYMLTEREDFVFAGKYYESAEDFYADIINTIDSDWSKYDYVFKQYLMVNVIENTNDENDGQRLAPHIQAMIDSKNERGN